MKIPTFTFPPPVDLMFYRAKQGGGIVSKPLATARPRHMAHGVSHSW